MQLVSLRDQKVCLDGLSISFTEYEIIQTARYYLQKPDFARLAAASELRVERVWMDDREPSAFNTLSRWFPAGRRATRPSNQSRTPLGE
jgi:hypothetical protein